MKVIPITVGADESAVDDKLMGTNENKKLHALAADMSLDGSFASKVRTYRPRYHLLRYLWILWQNPITRYLPNR